MIILPQSEDFNSSFLSLTNIVLTKSKFTLIKSVMGRSNSGYIKIRIYAFQDAYLYDVIYQRIDEWGPVYSAILEKRHVLKDLDKIISTYIRER